MPATIQPLGDQSPLDDTIGAMLLGVVVSAVLYGIAAVQTLYYFTRYPKDAWYIKALVVSTLLLDTVHLGLTTHTVYHYTISNYYDHAKLHIMTQSVILEALCTGFTGGLVQGFYTMRVWRLGDKSAFGTKLLIGLIVALILACTGCGTAWVIIAIQMTTFQELLTITPLTISINALSAVVDIIIATALCVMLQRSRTGFRGSDSMINKLTIFVVNTGLLTSICAVAALVSLIIAPKTLIYATFYFCIGRLYTNSLLASICVRKTIRNGFDDNSAHLSMPMSAVSPISDTNSSGFNFRFGGKDGIHFAHSSSTKEMDSMTSHGFVESLSKNCTPCETVTNGVDDGNGNDEESFGAGLRGKPPSTGNIAIKIETNMHQYRDEKAEMAQNHDPERGDTLMSQPEQAGVLGPYYYKRNNV